MLVMGMPSWTYRTPREASVILGLLLHMPQALQLKVTMNEISRNGLYQHWIHWCRGCGPAIDVSLFVLQVTVM